jgi:hypothetical protein
MGRDRAPSRRGLAASAGSTDFGEYFVYFSFFLVASALVLAALFFRLGVEQRAREVGLLRAVGFSTPRVRRLFAAEGCCWPSIGSADRHRRRRRLRRADDGRPAHVVVGRGRDDALTLHVSPVSLIAGAVGALSPRRCCIWWTLRGFARISERVCWPGRSGRQQPAERAKARAARIARRAARRRSPSRLG